MSNIKNVPEKEYLIHGEPTALDAFRVNITDEYNTRLSNQKFGWRISARIFTKDPIKSKHGGIITNAIQLIHPTSEDIWIIKGFKADGVTVHYNVYYKGKQHENCLSLDALNKIMVDKYCKGRKLTDADFGDQDV
jgi:hypothetical protein